jgi:bifunctional UDP-N-acetylglucosamine pyrophosphorylase/glucosamine-1-phosphate N-acetyltransferase/UDP-N-acetylglucosamine pyrophosphorylase
MPRPFGPLAGVNQVVVARTMSVKHDPPTASVAAPLAVVLAAGKGTRMGSDLPKVVFEAAGRPLVRWVLDALEAAGVRDRIVVVGHRAELVEAALTGIPGVSFALQREQRGTGDAVAAATAAIEERIRNDPPGMRRPVVIVCGDSPMLRPESVTGLLAEFERRAAACLLGTAVAADPAGLGRIVRDAAGHFERIVEEKDATPAQRQIREVNMSTYVFEARDLLRALARLDNANAAGEYYLTDCPALLLREGRTVDASACLDSSETLSVNTPEHLAAVAAVLSTRVTSHPWPRHTGSVGGEAKVRTD